jgi:hypothetical protein
MDETEELSRTYFRYNYHPAHLYRLIQETVAPDIESRHIKLVNGLKAPFSIEELETFLEMTASLPFFVFKNNLPCKDHDGASIESEILLKKSSTGKDCLRTHVSFYPYMENNDHEINLFVDLTNISPTDDEDKEIIKKGRKLILESYLHDYSVEDIQKIKFYPREVGYSHEFKRISLKNFRISKYLKKEEYPLFMDTPYIEDFVTFMCCR